MMPEVALRSSMMEVYMIMEFFLKIFSSITPAMRRMYTRSAPYVDKFAATK